jgi:nitrogen regulatory protein P-II 1
VKEIRAYVRQSRCQPVIEALAAAAHLDFSLLDVRGISQDLPKDAYQFSVQLGYVFTSMVKIELVCRDENADRLAEVVRQAAATGRKGDGRIVIAPVGETIRIQDGERGDGGLPD